LVFSETGGVTQSSNNEVYPWEYTSDCKVVLYLSDTLNAEIVDGSRTMTVPVDGGITHSITPEDVAGPGRCEKTGLDTTLPDQCPQSPDFTQQYKYCENARSESDRMQFYPDGRLTFDSKPGTTYYWEHDADCSLTLYLWNTVRADFIDGKTSL
jgi:hypothetical protein